MFLSLVLLYFIFNLVVLYRSMDRVIWEIGSCTYMLLSTVFIYNHAFLVCFSWIIILSVMAILRISSIKNRISDILFLRAKNSIPKLSVTEETALNAGDTWFEQDVFRGTLDFDKLDLIHTELTEDEQDFLENQVNILCSMLDEWSIGQARDLPKNVWDYIKKQGFFGLVIPKSYGGKGFSARAHSDIVAKIASRSGACAVTVMVPNSLGPGELLVHYGTEAQKDYYLPRLAAGIEIPCFALTEPLAGSDATSIQSEAKVVLQEVNGHKVLGLLITLNKRWITLAPVATLIGLAVNLVDPDGLLNGVGQEGITCVLIERDTDGLEIGNRHLPADLPFMNGTIRGHNLFTPITNIIGGQEKAGHGWEMLVECLSIGRSISLPALSVASAGVSYLTTGAYARIRRQFQLEIGQFEGVEEKLAEIAGLTYLANATRLFTLAAVNEGKKPSVASAIAKYYNTEFARIILNNAMDVHGGRTVVLGPRNYLVNHYHGIPIYVTVEGANIMSRNLLIFGQGSMACHPFVRDELLAVRQDNRDLFKSLIWQHISYFFRNAAKTFCTVWTQGRFIKSRSGALKSEYQQLTSLTYAFAFLADFSLIYLGGKLKRKERLSARLADGMSYLYLALSVLHYEAKHEESSADILHAKWALRYCFYHAQKAMLDCCRNHSSRILGTLVRLWAFPFGQTCRYPSDKLEGELAQSMMQNNHFRQNITNMLYLSGDNNEPIDKMEYALQLIIKHKDLYKKVGKLSPMSLDKLQEVLTEKVKLQELSQAELEQIMQVETARWDAILVDEFSPIQLANQVTKLEKREIVNE